MMLNLLGKEVIGDTLDAHIAKFNESNAVAYRWSQRLLGSSTAMAPIETIVWRKNITAVEQKSSTEFATKDPTDVVERYKDVHDSSVSGSDSRTD